MSAALSQALETVGRDLEGGILDAERELADSREHCRSLEIEVRALRAAIRADGPNIGPAGPPLGTSHPHAVGPTAAGSDPGADDTSTDYMPMLEELWGIARRDASN